MNGEALRWKWGLPGCTIATLGEAVTVWTGCALENPPTTEQIAQAEAEFADWQEALALGEYGPERWIDGGNEDMDTGTETLLEWVAPAVDAAWKIHGTLGSAGNLIALEALLGLRCWLDGYSVLHREVSLTVQTTVALGSAADVAWKDLGGDLLSDYDAESGMVRLRAKFESDNWTFKGEWQRVTRS